MFDGETATFIVNVIAPLKKDNEIHAISLPSTQLSSPSRGLLRCLIFIGMASDVMYSSISPLITRKIFLLEFLSDTDTIDTIDPYGTSRNSWKIGT